MAWMRNQLKESIRCCQNVPNQRKPANPLSLRTSFKNADGVLLEIQLVPLSEEGRKKKLWGVSILNTTYCTSLTQKVANTGHYSWTLRRTPQRGWQVSDCSEITKAALQLRRNHTDWTTESPGKKKTNLSVTETNKTPSNGLQPWMKKVVYRLY